MDIKPGDVLLMTRDDSTFIKLFCHCVGFLDNYDGKPSVCHAAIINRDGNCVTMWMDGLEVVSVVDELKGCGVCYQYRWVDASTDLTPVLATIDRYTAVDPPYAWMDYALLPFIAYSRKIASKSLSLLQQAELRAAIDACCEHIEGWIRVNKSAVICSELVYRCFVESGLHPEILMSAPDGDQLKMLASYVQPQLLARFGRLWSTFTAQEEVSSYWVTPADLIKSPSLALVGQIK